MALAHQDLVHEELADVEVAHRAPVVVAVDDDEAREASLGEAREGLSRAPPPGLALLGRVDLREAHALGGGARLERERVAVVDPHHAALEDGRRGPFAATGFEGDPGRDGQRKQQRGEGAAGHAASILRRTRRAGL